MGVGQRTGFYPTPLSGRSKCLPDTGDTSTRHGCRFYPTPMSDTQNKTTHYQNKESVPGLRAQLTTARARRTNNA